MFSNFLTNSMHDLSTEGCYSLANYFEAQADELRRVGEQKSRSIDSQNAAQITHIKMHKNLLLSGKMALDLVNEGVNKTVACGRAATIFSLEYMHVEANFLSQYRIQQVEIRKNRALEAIALHKKGLSIRKIAMKLGVSATTIHKIIKGL